MRRDGTTGAAPSTAGAPVHGGRLIAARAAFPDAPEPWIDLSTGISPFSYPVGALPDEAFRRLPEPEQEEALRRIAAAAFGASDPARVGLAPGSQMLISLLPLVLPCRSAAILHPGYAEHELAWRRAGVTVTRAGTIGALAEASEPGTVLVLCNPNNPDGRRVDGPALRALAERCHDAGGWLVVDEAYADLEPDVPDAASLLDGFPRLVVLRSFGKSYGLAGIRMGFLLAAPDTVQAIAALMGPWPVSGPALSLATRALADRAWREQAALRAVRDAARLDGMLAAAGLASLGGTALFRLASSFWADQIWDWLARAGILSRRFAERPDQLRFGLPPDEPAWDRLGAALREPGLTR